MKNWLSAFLFTLFTILTTPLFPQEISLYHARNLFLMGSGSAFNNGLLGFANPANNAMIQKFNARFYWDSQNSSNTDLDSWAFYTAVPGLGFGVQHLETSGNSVTDYSFSLASGSRRFGTGLAYSWSNGDNSVFNRSKRLTFGWIYRPLQQLSLGLVTDLSLENDNDETIVEAGLRPFSTHRITLFGDAAFRHGQDLNDAFWTAGAAVEVIPGLNLVGRYFRDDAFTVGLHLSFGGLHFGGQGHVNKDGERTFNTSHFSIGDYLPSVYKPFLSSKNYVRMNLKGRVDYQKYQWFDSNTQRFMGILQNIRQAADDNRVDVIALNLSAMRILPEHAWELREALKGAQQKGNKIIIFIDNAEMTGYHLASVADVVMMDPQGSLMLPGYVMSRTYLKGTLEKLGLGFDEWRFFKYKSAAEALSRDKMSDADREQRQDFTDDMYEVIRREVSAARDIPKAEFDKLIDESVFFLPDDALETGLVDTLCRWSNLNGVVKSLTQKKRQRLSMRWVKEDANFNPAWGETQKIAVVYALGVCEMDEGINARRLEKVLHKLAQKKSVKAVILRVDSPGGKGMASDYVAEALKKVAEKKPVIVSQGQVAASGGYWISMYADTILAGPTTITGSIGVIGGWVYDKGISGKLGLTSDYVKRGDKADLGQGVRLPLFGLQIPARNLTEAERIRVENVVRQMYDVFVAKVASGRNMSKDEIYEIAEGRIYSGLDGRDNGLVDEIGGLPLAIEMARNMAKIPDNRKYEIVEIPKYKGLFNTNFFSPVSLEKSLQQDPAIQFLKMMVDQPGYPLPMLLPGEYPVLE